MIIIILCGPILCLLPCGLLKKNSWFLANILPVICPTIVAMQIEFLLITWKLYYSCNKFLWLWVHRTHFSLFCFDILFCMVRFAKIKKVHSSSHSWTVDILTGIFIFIKIFNRRFYQNIYFYRTHKFWVEINVKIS